MFKILKKIYKRKYLQKTTFVFFVAFLFFFFNSELAFGAMSSDSFKIQSDVVGSFGAPRESTNFKINDTGGEIGTGISTSDSYDLGAGFWQTASEYQISIACDSMVIMGNITGTGQSALTTNSATCNVDTDNPAGYSLTWKASDVDMISSTEPLDKINSYTPDSAGVPETWSIDATTSEWGGHLGSASDTVNTTTWGSEDSYTNGKWINIGTTDLEIASRPDRSEIGGDSEVLWFGAEIGANKNQPAGEYDVSITVTAVAL